MSSTTLRKRWSTLKYAQKHRRIERIKGKPLFCEYCKTTDTNLKYDWANLDHKYRNNKDDYIRLCRPCHTKFDYLVNNKSKLSTWSRKFDKCVICNTTIYKHVSSGVCALCFERKRSEYKRFWYIKNKHLKLSTA